MKSFRLIIFSCTILILSYSILFAGGFRIENVLINELDPNNVNVAVKPISKIRINYSFIDYSFSGYYNKYRHFFFYIGIKPFSINNLYAIIIQKFPPYTDEKVFFNSNFSFKAPKEKGDYVIKFSRYPLFMDSPLSIDKIYIDTNRNLESSETLAVKKHLEDNHSNGSVCTFQVISSYTSSRSDLQNDDNFFTIVANEETKFEKYDDNKKIEPEIYLTLNNKWLGKENVELNDIEDQIVFSWTISNYNLFQDIKLRYWLFPIDRYWREWINPIETTTISFNKDTIGSGVHQFRAQLEYRNANNERTLSDRAIMNIIVKKALKKESDLLFQDFPHDIITTFQHGIKVNGKTTECEILGNNKIRFLGIDNIFRKGLNTISSLKQDFLFWLEKKKLVFCDTYKKSFAIIVAIDDYSHIKKYPSLKNTMVTNSKKIVSILLKLGFQQKNILTFFNDQANSGTIKTVLEKFWPGNEYSSCDRLFFYFGGHGDKIRNKGFLITYDFNEKRPYNTSLLLSDLTGRHSEYINANHLLLAIDACHSGLAINSLGSYNMKEKRNDLKKFSTLLTVQNEISKKARNLLLAATDDQLAVWEENGGIFTQSLISGLHGEADLTNDNIIEFAELALYIEKEVILRSTLAGHKQTPVSHSLTKGKFLFLIQ